MEIEGYIFTRGIVFYRLFYVDDVYILRVYSGEKPHSLLSFDLTKLICHNYIKISKTDSLAPTATRGPRGLQCREAILLYIVVC